MTSRPSTRLALKRSRSCPVVTLVDDEHVSKKTKVEVAIPAYKPSGYVAAPGQDDRKRAKTSRFNAKTGCHHINVVLPQPFFLTLTHVPNGTLAGRQVLIVDFKAQKKKGFLDLPGELRNQVYGYLFVKKGCDMSIQASGKTTHDQLQARPRYAFAPRLGFKVLYKGRDMSVHGFTLLATCRKVMVEAASYFYGYNYFHFQTTEMAHLFLSSIGKHNRERMTGIDLGWVLKRDIGRVAKLILDCKALEKLHFNLTMIPIPPYQSMKSPQEVVPPFKAILKEMYKRDDNDFFSRVTWAFSEPLCRHKADNIKMNDKILDVVGSRQVMEEKKIAENRARAAAMKAVTRQGRSSNQPKTTMRITRGASKRRAC